MRLSSLSVVLSAIATSVHADNQEDEDRHKHKATAKSNSDLNIPDNFKQITFDYELPYGQAWGIKFEIFDNIGPIAAKAGSVNDFADYDAYIKEVISKALKEHGTPVAFDVTLVNQTDGLFYMGFTYEGKVKAKDYEPVDDHLLMGSVAYST